ncbi:hypothetical protein Ga0080574_TMP928 [Salipiger abyssi]|uniref:Uncharacterized protein n=1 Tax=Salipiger abyssi TaxID=1250539 RepID=A0A1P8UPC2_9RHOB|nr:hypothetical protein Ga0080574_TMP928 [Salipiger abyssi]
MIAADCASRPCVGLLPPVPRDLIGLVPGHPAHIARLVPAIPVDAEQSVPLTGGFADVCEEHMEVAPRLVKGDAGDVVLRSFRIDHGMDDMRPRLVLFGFDEALPRLCRSPYINATDLDAFLGGGDRDIAGFRNIRRSLRQTRERFAIHNLRDLVPAARHTASVKVKSVGCQSTELPDPTTLLVLQVFLCCATVQLHHRKGVRTVFTNCCMQRVQASDRSTSGLIAMELPATFQGLNGQPNIGFARRPMTDRVDDAIGNSPIGNSAKRLLRGHPSFDPSVDGLLRRQGLQIPASLL